MKKSLKQFDKVKDVWLVLKYDEQDDFWQCMVIQVRTCKWLTMALFSLLINNQLRESSLDSH